MVLLASQLFQVGLNNIPPVTLAVLGLNVYLYLFPAASLMQVKSFNRVNSCKLDYVQLISTLKY